MATFDRSEIRRFRRDVWRAMRDAGLHPARIPAASVIVAVAVVGSHVPSLSAVTGLSQEAVVRVLRRLRKERVLSGQTLRVAWHMEGVAGELGLILDAMIATGELVRGVDEKRSASQKTRAPETRARGPRRPRTVVAGPFVPSQQKSNPLYGLPEWRDGK